MGRAANLAFPCDSGLERPEDSGLGLLALIEPRPLLLAFQIRSNKSDRTGLRIRAFGDTHRPGRASRVFLWRRYVGGAAWPRLIGKVACILWFDQEATV